MGFKDFVQNDIENVFINSNEFAEVHNLNGTQCYAVAEGLTDKQHVEIMGQDVDGLIYLKYQSTIKYFGSTAASCWFSLVKTIWAC